MQVTVKVDEKNLNIQRDMPDHASGTKKTKGIRVPDKRVHREAVGDTGASVCSSGTDMIEKLGIRKQDLLTTELALIGAQ